MLLLGTMVWLYFFLAFLFLQVNKLIRKVIEDKKIFRAAIKYLPFLYSIKGALKAVFLCPSHHNLYI
jgi:hypothetical protein